MTGRESRKLDAPAIEERVASNQESIGPVTHEGREGRLDLFAGACFEKLKLKSGGACSFQICFGSWGIGWIDQYSQPSRLGNQFAQQPKSLGSDLLAKKLDAGSIAARPSNAGDQTKLDGVFADAKHNRDRGGRSFGRK